MYGRGALQAGGERVAPLPMYVRWGFYTIRTCYVYASS